MANGSNDSGNTLLIFLAGTIIGAGLGLLFAPKSGRETRRQLADMAQKAQLKASEAASRFGGRVQDAAEEMKGAVARSPLGKGSIGS